MNLKFGESQPFAYRFGFTLIELLVVIGIIAMLIGILLPTLARARNRSRQVACMSNMSQIGVGIVMYANDNKDHFPDAVDAGNWPYRRQPGMRDPNDPSSRPEWLGIAAVLAGIKPLDYNTGMSISTVAAGLQVSLAKPRYLSAISSVWVCPAAQEMFTQYGNTYCYVISATASADVGALTSNGRAKLMAQNANSDELYENTLYLPYVCGSSPVSSTGSGVSGYQIKKAIYPHPYGSGKKLGYNLLYLDGHVDMVRP